MTRKEKYFLFVALQTIIECLKYKALGDVNPEEYNKRLDDVIKFLEELKGKNHD